MRQFMVLLSAIIIQASCTSNPPLQQADQANKFMAQGSTQFERSTLLRLADASQQTGNYPETLAKRQQALEQAQGDNAQIAALHSSLGQLYFFKGDMKQARRELNKSIGLAKQAKQPALQALGLLRLGRVLAAQRAYNSAQIQFIKSVRLAQKNNQPTLAIEGLINRVGVFLEMGNQDSAQIQFVSLWNELQQLPNGHEKAYLLLKLSKMNKKIAKALDSQSLPKALIAVNNVD